MLWNCRAPTRNPVAKTEFPQHLVGTLNYTVAQCTLKEFSNYSPQNQAETKILRGGFIPREWRLALSRTREPAPSSIFRESTSTRCFSLNLEFRTPKVLLCKAVNYLVIENRGW